MICVEEDDFTFEQPRWVAYLSNGVKVLQDDGRPGFDPPQAWLRLKQYCRDNYVDIVNLTLQFRSHHEAPLPANAPGYFFCNRAISIDYGPTIGFYLIGVLMENKVHVLHWKIPELILMDYDERKPDEYYLIRRTNNGLVIPPG